MASVRYVDVLQTWTFQPVLQLCQYFVGGARSKHSCQCVCQVGYNFLLAAFTIQVRMRARMSVVLALVKHISFSCADHSHLLFSRVVAVVHLGQRVL